MPGKCHLLQSSVHYLGHVLSADGVHPDDSKFSAVRDWPEPTSVPDVRRFVGFVSYYRRFIRHFSVIAAPLNALTQKHASFVWTPACAEAFSELKHRLVSAPIWVIQILTCDLFLIQMHVMWAWCCAFATHS